MNKERLKRFVKSTLWSFGAYWLIRAPLQVIFTEVLGIWYVLSNFMAGCVLLVIGFIVGEFWIWKDKNV